MTAPTSPIFDVPYYAVVFSSQRQPADDGYDAMAEQMVELARAQPGYLGIESARDDNGFGITVSYWQDQESIRSWKQQVDHQLAQRLGRERWYENYRVRVARVERDYDFQSGADLSRQ